jgi:predicted glycosyltransferase
MRDVTFGPEQTRSIWTNEGVYPLLDDVYDRILVYGDQDVFDPVSAYAISDRAAAKMRFCGYLAPRPSQRSPAEVRRDLGVGGAPLVAVSVGGGVDGGPLLRAYLEGLPDFRGSRLHSYVVTGPLLPENERGVLASLARSQPDLHIVDFEPDFAAVVQAADVVVCMGGYNSLTEAVYFGKRPVVVPRPPGPEEQLIRAEGFAHFGLATVVRPESLTSAALWQAIEQELARMTSLASSLPLDGANVVAHELAELAYG